ncbi:MAG: hypothetical protein SH850_24495, partial [Planctomycetaceae bacterium]|nr:hypothetical protein [Planctomycetaceae bacterium]
MLFVFGLFRNPSNTIEQPKGTLTLTLSHRSGGRGARKRHAFGASAAESNTFVQFGSAACKA